MLHRVLEASLRYLRLSLKFKYGGCGDLHKCMGSLKKGSDVHQTQGFVEMVRELL